MTSVKRFLKAVEDTIGTSGRVVASTETTLSVATRSGVILVPKDTMSLYSVGNEVRVANGVIVGKKKDTSTLPVYYV